MYGTVAKFTFKPGMQEPFMAAMDAEQGDPDPGSVAVFGFTSDEDPDVGYMVAVFKSKEAYRKNADRPETNARFERMMEFMASEPEWHDGEVVYSEINT